MTKTAKTKIIATIGPSSWDNTILTEMFKKGMQIARINASFADDAEITRVTKQLREISPRIAVILDTQGAKIRVTNLEKEIEVRDYISLSPRNIPNTIQVSYPNLTNEIGINTKIILDDGTIELQVIEIKGEEIICKVIQGGILKPNKTVNIPDINLNFPLLSEKDKRDITSAINNKVDFVCVSFVRNAQDILEVKELLKDTNIKVIAKIENQLGIDNFDEILEQTDTIMIARGDLGVETPLEQIPIIQKQMIYKCRTVGKPVIVATQMLESMRENKRPTRAEVSDVANSVMDGTDAIMLSAETSTGKYPVEAVETMSRVALATESVMQMTTIYGRTSASYEVDEIAKTVCNLSESIPLKGIAVISDSTYTIASITRHRPNVPIWSISSSLRRVRQDSIYRGVKTYIIADLPTDRDQSISQAIQTIYTHGELDLTDKIAIISGSSIKHKGSDAILEIVTIKDVLDK